MTTPQDPPVSVKAALRCGDGWVLLRNERGQWELPGGRIDATDASLEDVVRRECREELGIDVDVGPLVDAYLFEVVPGRRVTIVCYLASVPDHVALTISDEHNQVGVFSITELDEVPLPQGYRHGIEKAALTESSRP